ncbi:MAG: LysM peptidoglycan-binding domain-containing protein [Actinomycetota bacterium]
MSTYNHHSYQDPYYTGGPRRRPRPSSRPPVSAPQYQFRRRVVAISMLGLLVAPVAWAMRDDGKAVDVAYSGGAAAVVQFDPTAGNAPAVAPPSTVAPPVTVPAATPAPAPAEPAPVVCAAKYTVQAGDSWYGIAEAAGVKASLIAGVNNMTLKSNLLVGEEICLPPGAAVPPVKTTATQTKASSPKCSGSYTVKSGDSWNRIANLYSVSATELAAVNGMTLSSTLLIGDTLCLPIGAKAPSTTTATTSAPKTSYTRAELEQMVRDIWPDELEANAFYVVNRESRWVPTAQNWCCYGLFQLNWLAHQTWMKNYGVSDPSQLLNPETNIRLAYVVYQRAGSWKPWCTSSWCPVS